MTLAFIPYSIKADSGLDANYDDGNSVVGSVISGGSNVLPLIGELGKIQKGSEDYATGHIVVAIICIIIFYIVACVCLFKLNKNYHRKAKEVFKLLGLSLIPTLLFSLLILLIKLELLVYFFITAIISIISIIAINIIVNKKYQKNILKVKEEDKKFNEDEFNKEVFDIYKNIQIKWMNFKLDDVKELLADDIYEDYKKKLDDLKNDNRKNIMDNIEYVSNKITDMYIKDNIETIECNMNITCNDYIINDKEEVVKGKKDKKNDYTYLLIFNKDLKTKKYKLVYKKMLKQK
jgi:Ca2+/Na+ antiporter